MYNHSPMPHIRNYEIIHPSTAAEVGGLAMKAVGENAYLELEVRPQNEPDTDPAVVHVTPVLFRDHADGSSVIIGELPSTDSVQISLPADYELPASLSRVHED